MEDIIMPSKENCLSSNIVKNGVARSIGNLSNTRTSTEKSFVFWSGFSLFLLMITIIVGSLILYTYDAKQTSWIIWGVYAVLYALFIIRNIMIFQDMNTTLERIKDACSYGIFVSLFVILVCMTVSLPSLAK